MGFHLKTIQHYLAKLNIADLIEDEHYKRQAKNVVWRGS